MKKNYLRLLLTLTLLASIHSQAQITFTYTGTVSTYTVHPGVSHISIEAKGAKGLDGDPALGGNGATMYGEFYVTPGDVLTYYVGGNSAGLKAGGDGTYVENTTAGTILIVAGGGGGGTHSQVGDGAPTTNNGTASISHPGYTDGAAGVAGGGGGAGTGAWGTGGGGGWLSAGASGSGSPGGALHCRASYGTTFAGGAGGGYSGGGGVDMDSGWGTGGGGAGGSYNVGENQVNVAANNAGLGQIIIDQLCTPLTITVSDYTICLGETVTIEATSETDATITWLDGFDNGIPFIPDGAGFHTYLGVSSDGSDCGAAATITVFPDPTIVANVDEDFICEGDEITLHGTGGATYSWSPAFVIDDEPFTPPLGVSTYIVTGTTGVGCVNTDTITIEVFESPTVTGSADDYAICYGETVTFSGAGALSYEWSPGAIENGVPYSPPTAGETIYTVIGTNGVGCQASDEVTVTMNAEIVLSYTVIDESVGVDGSIDLTVAGGTPSYTFDWDNDGTGDFDDTEDLAELAGGTYIVVISDAAGCSATESIVVNSQLGLANYGEEEITIYPNPTASVITILTDGHFSYSISAMNGQILGQGVGVSSEEVSLTNLAPGTYLITLTTANKTSLVKVVKI
jgi:hypothetical protein